MTIQELIDSLHMENTPAGGRLLVLELMKATTSQIILAGDNREAPEPGIVLRIGADGVGPESGRLVPVASKPGDVIWYGRYAGLRTTVEGPPSKIDGRRPMVPVLLMQDAEVLMRRDDPASYELIIHDDAPHKVHRAGLICEFCAPVKVDLAALKVAAGQGEVIDAEVDEAEEERRRILSEQHSADVAQAD